MSKDNAIKNMLSELLPETTHNDRETEAIGRALAGFLSPGDVLALHGDLGAGKTHLVRGLCAALGIDAARVSSPTFTLIHEYDAPVPVYHIDAYRIARAAELLDLGFDEYLSAGAIVVIEWAERVASLLPPETYHLCIEHGGGDMRHLRWCSEKGHQPA